MNNVGGIEYDVVANTGELLKAEQETQRSVKNIEGSMKKLGSSSAQVDKVTKSVGELGKEADSSGFALSRMQKALLGAFTVGSALTIGKMADDYRTLTERVRFATESQEEYDIVQKRLIQSANESYRSLQEASEVFIGTSDNLRSLGFSLDEALDIADSLSFSFVKNATATDRARNAINAYDNALNRGIVSTLDWRTINNAIPTLAQDIAKSLGKSTDEILKMGNAGEISASLLNETLLKTFDANRDAATGMATTIEDAFIKLRTNLSVFVGEANKTAGATDLVAASIDLVAENINTLATLLIATGAGAMARYVTQMGLMTVAKMRDSVATRASIAEEVRLAQANLAAAQAEVARTASLVAKGGAMTKHTQAINAQAIAVANLDRAEKAAMVTTRGFLAVLGGPAGLVGLLTLGVTAFSMFSLSAKDTDIEIKELTGSVEELTKKFIEMSDAQRAAAMIEYGKEQIQAVKNVDTAYVELMRTVVRTSAEFTKSGKVGEQSIRDYVESAFEEAQESGEDFLKVIARIGEDLKIPQDTIDTWITQNAVLDKANTQLGHVNGAIAAVSRAQKDLASSTNEASEALRRQNEINATGGTELDKWTQSLQRQTNSIEDGGKRLNEYNRFIKEQEDAGVKWNEEQKKQIESNRSLASAIDSQKESVKSSTAEIDKSTGVIASMREELRLATLSGKEAAIARAENQLNKYATEQEVQTVRDLAAALYDLKTIGGTKEDQDSFIDGETGSLTGGAFDDQIARYEEEANIEMQRYADQLERLMQARETQLQTEDEYNQKELELQERHNERMGRIEQAKNSVRLNSYSDSASAIADVLANSNAEQSGFYKAAFAVAKGFAIADATINAWDAVSKAWASAPFPANLGAVAATTPAVMGVISSIQGTNYGGGRQYGGPVSAGSMYRINETGESEIFNAGGGKQYFIPNENGKVVPAKDVGSGGSANVTVNIIEDPSRAGERFETQTESETVIDIIVADIMGGGNTSRALESTYAMNRQGS